MLYVVPNGAQVRINGTPYYDHPIGVEGASARGVCGAPKVTLEIT